MVKGLQNKVALVTGAAQGIGRGLPCAWRKKEHILH